MALVVDKMNDVIYSLKDLQDELNIPILGLIPRRDDEQKSLADKTTIDRCKQPPHRLMNWVNIDFPLS
jgi:hypothetical protein